MQRVLPLPARRSGKRFHGNGSAGSSLFIVADRRLHLPSELRFSSARPEPVGGIFIQGSSSLVANVVGTSERHSRVSHAALGNGVLPTTPRPPRKRALGARSSRTERGSGTGEQRTAGSLSQRSAHRH